MLMTSSADRGKKYPPVIIYEEDILAVISPLCNMMSTTCNNNSRASWHNAKLADQMVNVNQKIGSVPIILLFLLFNYYYSIRPYYSIIRPYYSRTYVRPLRYSRKTSSFFSGFQIHNKNPRISCYS